VRKLVPITGHTHITDARRHDDGTFDLLLLGDGDLDSATYVRAMAEAGWDSYITLEVSARVWGRDDYDVQEAARRSYASLDGAFREAGVTRG
jgi:sugar phosphate isomerase/epimerase